MKSGNVSSKCVSGGAECPLWVGWWSSWRLPCRPVRVIRALCHRPLVIGTGDLVKHKDFYIWTLHYLPTYFLITQNNEINNIKSRKNLTTYYENISLNKIRVAGNTYVILAIPLPKLYLNCRYPFTKLIAIKSPLALLDWPV